MVLFKCINLTIKLKAISKCQKENDEWKRNVTVNYLEFKQMIANCWSVWAQMNNKMITMNYAHMNTGMNILLYTHHTQHRGRVELLVIATDFNLAAWVKVKKKVIQITGFQYTIWLNIFRPKQQEFGFGQDILRDR